MSERIVINVDRDGWTKKLQLSMSEYDENDHGTGYRLAGPKYNGSSANILRAELDERDAAEIRAMLDDVFPLAAVPSQAQVLHQAARLLEQQGYSDDAVNWLDTYADYDPTGAAKEKDTATSAATSTPAETAIYRAAYEHEAIPLGLYTNPAAARAHCEGTLRSEYPATVSLVFDWIGDEDDPEQPWELVAFIDGGAEQLTGYVVTPLTVATEYDPEAEG